MRYIICLVLAAVAVSAFSDEDRRRIALQNPDLFEGDILGIDPDDRNVIPYTQMRWPGGKVPYEIDSTIDAKTKKEISIAMDNYHAFTCVKFVPRTIERNYIRIFSGQGCYSYVGMINRGKQDVSIGKGCEYVGTIIHELGHALGFFHEQNRSDRDEYLIIYWENIRQGMENQFTLLKSHENLLLTSFDHDSIMLYGNYAFSKDGRSLTMVAKNGKRLLEPYDKKSLSSSDMKRVKKMYSC